MGVRENKVENYLDEQVTKLGGITRKWVSPNRNGVPDRIVIINGRVFFIEVKTIDGKLSTRQKHEHKLLENAGADVATIYGEAGVDYFIKEALLK